MNPILQIVLNSLVKYLENNPQQVEMLVQTLLDFLVKEIQKNKAG